MMSSMTRSGRSGPGASASRLAAPVRWRRQVVASAAATVLTVTGLGAAALPTQAVTGLGSGLALGHGLAALGDPGPASGDPGWVMVAAAAARSDARVAEGGVTLSSGSTSWAMDPVTTAIAPGARVWRSEVQLFADDPYTGWSIPDAAGHYRTYKEYHPDQALADYPRIRQARFTVEPGETPRAPGPSAMVPAPPDGSTTVTSTGGQVTVTWSLSSGTITRAVTVVLIDDPAESDSSALLLSKVTVGAPEPYCCRLGVETYSIDYSDPGLQVPTDLARNVPADYAAAARLAAWDTSYVTSWASDAVVKTRQATARLHARASLVGFLRRNVDGAPGRVVPISNGVALVDVNHYSGVRTTWRITVSPRLKIVSRSIQARCELAPLR